MTALSPDAFPLRAVETLRYADTDRQGHINNAVYATLFETGRVALFNADGRRAAPQGCEFVLARLEIDFLAEMHWPGEADIRSAVAKIGTSSVRLTQAVFKDGVATARAESVAVLMDSASRRPAPLPPEARAALEAAMAPQG